MIDLVGDGQADDTRAIEDALASFSSRGGTLTLPVGRHVISRTIKVPPGVVVEGQGRPSPNGVDRATMPGAWVVTADGFDGPIFAAESTRDVSLSRIGFDGGDRGPTTKSVGLSIQSDSAKDPRLATNHVSIAECSFSFCGTGILWGRGVLEEQSDHVRIEHCTFIGDVVGIAINSGNAGDYSRIVHCSFGVTETAIDLIASGFLSIRDCAAGGLGATFVRRRSGSDSLLIENSQCEGMAAFLAVDAAAADDAHTITLVGNSIDCPVLLNTICRVVGIGNLYQAPLVMRHAGAKYQGVGDRLHAAAGGKVDCKSGSYVNQRLRSAGQEPAIPGERILDEVAAAVAVDSRGVTFAPTTQSHRNALPKRVGLVVGDEKGAPLTWTGSAWKPLAPK